jgi:hypothetical protein
MHAAPSRLHTGFGAQRHAASKYPGDLLAKGFGPRMVCTKCGMVGADVRPNWKER